MTDFFRPHHQPAQAIYDAFQAAAKNREGSTLDWITKERNAVWEEAKKQAAILQLPPPTLAMVEQAETYASGSIDYGANWAYKLTEIIQKGKPQ